MGRSGYSDDCDGWALIRWRGAVTSAIRGARGQKMLRDLLEALDAMPEKKLYPDELVTSDGEACALGVLGQARGIDMTGVDTEDRLKLGAMFDIAPALAAEIMFENDEDFLWEGDKRSPEARWMKVRSWVARHISEAP